MRQPESTQKDRSTAAQERKPGRSFDDPSKPLGQDILERSQASDVIHEDLRDRAEQAATQPNGVAERAKAIAVLRKFEELVATDNIPVDAEDDVQRALELACGRVGLTYKEFRALVDGDQEIMDLERKCVSAARGTRG